MDRRKIFKCLAILGLGTVISLERPNNLRRAILLGEYKSISFSELKLGDIFKFDDDVKYWVATSKVYKNNGINTIECLEYEI